MGVAGKFRALLGSLLVGNGGSAGQAGRDADYAELPVGTDGQVLIADSTRALGVKWGAGGNTFIPAYKGADGAPVNNSIVLVADPDLKFDIGANEVWQWLFGIWWVQTDNSINMKFTFSGPAAPNIVYFGNTDLGAFEGAANAFLNTLLDSSSAAPTAAAPNYLFGTGFVKNGPNPGTVQFEFAQAVASMQDTYLTKGSYLIAHKLT